MKIFITYHKETSLFENSILTPIHAGRALSDKALGMIGDDTGDHISERNREWSELSVIYWMWKNVEANYYGLFHYRRLFSFSSSEENFFHDASEQTVRQFGLDEESIKSRLEGVDILLPPKWNVHPGLDPQRVMTIYEFYAKDHVEEHLRVSLEVIDELYPEYSLAAKVVMCQKQAHYFNMFVMRREIFHRYAEWIFTILFEVEKRIIVDREDPYQRRAFGFLSERLINVFLFHEQSTHPTLKIDLVKQVPLGIFDNQYPLGLKFNEEPRWKSASSYIIPPKKRQPHPTVSVIVPVYNVEKYLAACLNSILSQTLHNIEIIVVNDGSTDGSQKIIDTYASIDRRIIVIEKENGGLSSARNAGLKRAEGEYIFFVDSDDYIEPIALDRLYERMTRDDLEIVCCTTNTVDANSEEMRIEPYYNDTHLPIEIESSIFTAQEIAPYLFDMQVSAWNKLYKQSFLKRVQAEFPEGLIFEDNIFFLTTLLHAQGIAYLKQPLYNYRINRSDSIISGRSKRFFDFFAITRISEQILRESPYWEQLKTHFFTYRVNSLYHWYTLITPDSKERYYEELQFEFATYDLKEYEAHTVDIGLFNLYANVLNGSAKIAPEKALLKSVDSAQQLSPLQQRAHNFSQTSIGIIRESVKWLFALIHARSNEKKLHEVQKELRELSKDMARLRDRGILSNNRAQFDKEHANSESSKREKNTPTKPLSYFREAAKKQYEKDLNRVGNKNRS